MATVFNNNEIGDARYVLERGRGGLLYESNNAVSRQEVTPQLFLGWEEQRSPEVGLEWVGSLADQFQGNWELAAEYALLANAKILSQYSKGGEKEEQIEAVVRAAQLLRTLKNFLESEDFDNGCVSATRAAYGGSGYSVELYPCGKWQVLWNNSIGNGYNSPGVILSLPTYESAYEPGEQEERTFEAEALAVIEALSYDNDAKPLMVADFLEYCGY